MFSVVGTRFGAAGGPVALSALAFTRDHHAERTVTFAIRRVMLPDWPSTLAFARDHHPVRTVHLRGRSGPPRGHFANGRVQRRPPSRTPGHARGQVGPGRGAACPPRRTTCRAVRSVRSRSRSGPTRSRDDRSRQRIARTGRRIGRTSRRIGRSSWPVGLVGHPVTAEMLAVTAEMLAVTAEMLVVTWETLACTLPTLAGRPVTLTDGLAAFAVDRSMTGRRLVAGTGRATQRPVRDFSERAPLSTPPATQLSQVVEWRIQAERAHFFVVCL